jgi:hypothetical protein
MAKASITSPVFCEIVAASSIQASAPPVEIALWTTFCVVRCVEMKLRLSSAAF